MFGSKVKPEQGDESDFSFDSFDDNDFGFDDTSKDDRKPGTKLRRALTDSVEAKANDDRYKRELLKATLPSEYSAVLEDYDTVSKEAGSIWREQQKEWEKHRREIKKVFKPYADVMGAVPGLKKISEWANEEERSRDAEQVSDEQMDELKIQGILSETFGQMQQQAAADNLKLDEARQIKADETEASAKVDRDNQIQKTIEGNQLLLSINNSLAQTVAYNNNMNFPYQKRTLELSARQLITQQRMLQTMKDFSVTTVAELKEIHKNTGLPEYLKITPKEMAQQSIANRVLGGVTAPFANVGKQLATNVANKVKGKMKEFWEMVGSGAAELNMQNDSMADGSMGGDGTAWGGLKQLGLGWITDSIMNKPAEFIKNKIAPKARDLLERHTNIKLHGTNLKSLGNNFAGIANEALKKGSTGNKFFDAFINAFDLQGAAITGNRTAFDNSNLDLEKAAFIDQRFKLSVTEVIPAWLKKIYGEVFAFNNDGTKPKDMVWDFRESEFVDRKEMNERLEDRLIDKDKLKRQALAVNNWVDIIAQQTLSERTREWVSKWVLREYAASNAINPLKLLASDLSCPADIKEELAYALPVTLKLSKQQMDLVKDGTADDLSRAMAFGTAASNQILDRAADAVSGIVANNPLKYEELNKMTADVEERRYLKESGWVTKNGNAWDLNQKRVEQYQDNVEIYRPGEGNTKGDWTYKPNQKIVDDDGRDVVGDDIEDLDSKYGYAEARLKTKNTSRIGDKTIKNAGTFYLSDRERQRRAIVEKVNRMPDPESRYNEGWGTEYFIDKMGKIHTAADKNFLKKRKQLRPDIERAIATGSYASGGRIRSFGSGGSNTPTLKEGPTQGQPGDETIVKAHGGEFVVAHDAAKFNVKLLDAINRYGAPLINADGSINSVYHKTLGFNKAKDMGRDLLAGGKNVKNEQVEIAIKNILENIKPIEGIDYEKIVKEITGKSKSPEKRLALASKHWTNYQRAVLKQKGYKNYGKDLASQGISVLNGKFENWLDFDGTGTNIEIKNRLMAGARELGKNAATGVKGTAKDLGNRGKAKFLDRAGTLAKVDVDLREADNPKRFNTPLDLYFKGKGSPFVTKHGFTKGEYIDKLTGKIIKNPAEITGDIVDTEGNEIVSVSELLTNEVVTRSRKPYTLLGMKDANRRFFSADEYAKETLNIIKASQRYQDMVDKANAAKDKYLIDKPIDLYTRDDATTPVLTAKGFAEGKYIDKNTGNVLWSHHDITGPVVNASNEELLSQAELDDGLFDSKREHVKISKLKQYRNMAFKRTAEAYKKYGAKHVDKLTGALAKQGEKYVGLNYDKNPIDIYVMGEDEPRIKALEFKQGIIFCGDKQIKSHSGITGPVSKKENGSLNIVLEAKDFGNIVDGTGERVKLVGVMKAGERFANYLKEAILPTKLRNKFKLLTMSADKRAEYLDNKLAKAKIAFDVYLKGEPTKPLLTKDGFEKGLYISAKTSKVIRVPEQIDGPILDAKGNQIVTEEHIKKGLEDVSGNKVDTSGGLFGRIKASFNVGKRLKGALSKSVDPNTGMLTAIADKLGIKGIGERVGGWKWLRANKEEKKKEEKKEEKKEKKEGWISKLVKRFMTPLTVMFGALSSGLGIVKTALLTGISWLGKSIVTKSLGGGLGSFLSGAMGGGGKFGGIAKAIVAGAAVYGGIKAYKYLDGDAGSQSTYEQGMMNGLDPTSRVLNADRIASGQGDKDNGSFIDSVLNNPLASGIGTAAMMAPGTTWKVAKGAGKLGWAGAKGLGRVAGTVGGGVAKGLGRTALKVAPKLAGGIANVASKAGTVANLARIAAPAVMSGAAGIGGSVLSGVGSALAFLTGPVGLTVLGVAAVAGAAYYFGKKLWNNHKNPWNRFRMAQYGFNHNDKDILEKISKIEGLATSLVKVSDKGDATLKADEKAITEVLKVVGIKDQDGNDIEDQQHRLPKFASWFKLRFVRVYASYLRTLKRLKGKAEMIDLQTLNRPEQEILLKEVHFVDLTTSPYAVTFSPFEKPKECEMMSRDVDIIARKLKNKIGQLPEVPNYVEPGYKKDEKDAIKPPPENADGLDDKQAKDPGKNATPEEKTKYEQDKALDKESNFTKVGWKEPKTMVDEANKVIKYQTDSAKVITEQHNKTVQLAADKVTEETNKTFEKGSTSLLSKFTGFISGIATRFGNAWDKIKNGDVLAGLGEAAAAGASVMTGGATDILAQGASYVSNKVAGWTSDGKGLGGTAQWSKGKRDSLFPEISAAAKKYGLNERAMLTMAYIESRGDPNAKNPSGAAGIYQFMPDTARAYGLYNPLDQTQNIDAGMRLTRDNIAYFKKTVGREPEPYELYLMHQQGMGGAAQISKAAATGGNVSATIRKNMNANAPQPNMSPAAFLAHWKNKFANDDRLVHGDGGGAAPVAAAASAGGSAPAPTPAAAPTSTAGVAAAATAVGGGSTMDKFKAASAVGSSAAAATAIATAAPAKGGSFMTTNTGMANKDFKDKSDAINKKINAKPKWFCGDSIADGFKRHHKGTGWTQAGVGPSTVLRFLRDTILKKPDEYRGKKEVYLSTGIMNDTLDFINVGNQLSALKDANIRVYVFGLTTTFNRGNAAELNSKLASLCKTYGHKFLGSYPGGKDPNYPATWSFLIGTPVKTIAEGGAKGGTPLMMQGVKTTKSSVEKKVTELDKKTNTSAPPANNGGSAAAVKQPAEVEAKPGEVMTNGATDWNFSKVAKAALKNCLPESKGKCGEYTRKALMAGDLKGKISKICGGSLGYHAYQFPTKLKSIGFNPVYSGKKLGSFVPQVGDVAIFDKGLYGKERPTKGGWVSGHACVFTGGQWVSDFVQKSIYPHSRYAADGLMFTIFRADGIAPEGGFSCEPGDGEAQDGYSSAPSQAGQVSDKMTSISNGAPVDMNTTGFSNNIYGQQSQGNGTASFNGGDVTNVLNQQLDIQKEILSVLKEIAGKPRDPNSTDTTKTEDGAAIDSNGNPINGNQQQQGLTKPDMSSVSSNPANVSRSPYEGIPNPISVKKPA